jgi:TonB family protein
MSAKLQIPASALAISVAIHITLFATLLTVHEEKKSEEVITLNLEAIFAPPKEVIPPKEDTEKRTFVSKPDLPPAKKDAPPRKTNRLAAKNFTSKSKEQVRRGDGGRKATAAKVTTETPPKKQVIKSLTLDKSEALARYGAKSIPPERSKANLKKFGTNDYLPTLPDGELTFLNAKANRFAVFVERVATRVFQQLKSSGIMKASSTDLLQILKNVRYEAILSKEGKLLSIRLVTPSGSSRFDAVVEEAIKRGAPDPNPPKEALTPAKTIHFIFESRSWSERGYSSRTGIPDERRWILLGTGLL